MIARAVIGTAAAGAPSANRDHATVEALLPNEPAAAARLSIALMELGALVCTARAPRCDTCPVNDLCAWRSAGSPAYDGPTPRPQRFSGTDRQVRGLLLDVLRSSRAPATQAAMDATWAEPVQRARALDSLIADGLVRREPDGHYAFPN